MENVPTDPERKKRQFYSEALPKTKPEALGNDMPKIF
jgi:hypothetical protein